MMSHLTDATIDQYVKKQLPDLERLSVKVHTVFCRECAKRVRQYHEDEAFIRAYREGFGKMNTSFSDIQDFLNEKGGVKQENNL